MAVNGQSSAQGVVRAPKTAAGEVRYEALTGSLRGEAGIGVRHNLPEIAKAGRIRASEAVSANLDFWFLYLPGRHPMLEWFALFVNHLRTAERPKPQHTHEFVLIAVDPETYIEPLSATFDPENVKTYRAMPPSEVEEKIMGLTDDAAVELCRRLATAAISGTLFPMGDAGAWVAIIEHFKQDLQQ